MTTTAAIKLDEPTRQRLKSLGQKLDRSPHWIMKKAIEQYLSDQERYWREREEDEARWQEYQTTGHAIPHAEVARWLESLGTDHELPCPK